MPSEFRLGMLVFAPRSLVPEDAVQLRPSAAIDKLREEARGERAYRLLELAAELGAFVATVALDRHAYERELAFCVEWLSDGLERGDLVAFEPHLPASARGPAGAGMVADRERAEEEVAREPPQVREPQPPPVVIPVVIPPVEPARERLRIAASSGRVRQDVEKPFDVAIELRVIECDHPVPHVRVEAGLDGEATGAATTDEEGVVSFVVRDSPDPRDRELTLKVGVDEGGGNEARYAIAERIRLTPAEKKLQRVLKVKNAIEIRRAAGDPGARGYPEVDLCERDAKVPEPSPDGDRKSERTRKWKRTKAFDELEHAVLHEVALLGLTEKSDARVAIGSALRPLAPWRVRVRGGENLRVSPESLAFAPSDPAEPAPGFSIQTSPQGGADGELVYEVVARPQDVPKLPSPRPPRPYTAVLEIHGEVADSDVDKPGEAYLQVVTAGDDALALIEPHVFEELSITAQIWVMNERGGASPLDVGRGRVDLQRVKDGVAAIWGAAGIRVTFLDDRVEERSSGVLDPRLLDHLHLMNEHFTPGTCNIYVVRDLSTGGGLTVARRQWRKRRGEPKLLFEVGAYNERHPPQEDRLLAGRSGIQLATRAGPIGEYSREPYTDRLEPDAPPRKLWDAITIDLAHELGHFLSLPHVGFEGKVVNVDPPMIKRLMYGELHPDPDTSRDFESLPFHGILIAPSCKKDIDGLCEAQCARAAVRWKDYVELWPAPADAVPHPEA